MAEIIAAQNTSDAINIETTALNQTDARGQSFQVTTNIELTRLKIFLTEYAAGNDTLVCRFGPNADLGSGTFFEVSQAVTQGATECIFTLPAGTNLVTGTTYYFGIKGGGATTYFSLIRNSVDAYADGTYRGSSNWNLNNPIATKDIKFELYGDDGGAGGGDTIAPDAITDLSATVYNNDVLLSFTESGDDGTTGQASQYDVRYSTTAITNDTEFNAATQATSFFPPGLPGEPSSILIPGLTPDQQYYFAVKTGDEVPNWSAMSNVVTATPGAVGNVKRLFASQSGIWTVHQRPTVIYRNGKTFAAAVADNGDVWAGSYDHATQTEVVTVLGSTSIDDHNNPAMIFRDDGRLVCIWSDHNGANIYRKISTNPEDVSAFGSQLQLASTKGGGYTYPQPVGPLPNGDYWVLCRRSWTAADGQDGASGMTTARRVWDILVTSDDFATLSHSSMPLWFQSDVNTPYTEPTLVEQADSSVHIHFVRSDWRYGEISSVRDHVMYCYYDSTTNAFHKADGTQIAAFSALPITDRTQLDLVYDSLAVGGQDAFAADVAADAIGNVAVVFTTLDATENNHAHYAYWGGVSWQETFVVTMGKDFTTDVDQPAYNGFISINHSEISEMYMGREQTTGGGEWEIERWKAFNGGQNVEMVEAISSKDGTQPVKVFRPFVPRNAHESMDVVWCAATTYTTFNNYNSTIQAYSPTSWAFVPDNTAPVASFTVDNATPTIGQTVTATDTSTDADGDTLTRSWLLTPPGGSAVTPLSGNGATFAFTPDVVGNYTLSLTVDDGTANDSTQQVITASVAMVSKMIPKKIGFGFKLGF